MHLTENYERNNLISVSERGSECYVARLHPGNAVSVIFYGWALNNTRKIMIDHQ